MIEEIETIFIENQPIKIKTVDDGKYASFEVDTIKSSLDLVVEAVEKLSNTISDFELRNPKDLRRGSATVVGKTYFSTPKFKRERLKKLRRKFIKIIKDSKSYEEIGGE